MKRVLTAATLALATTASSAAYAGDYDGALMELAQSTLADWVTDPVVTGALVEQNGGHAGLSDQDIIDLDNTWRAGVDAGSSPLIDDLLSRPVSAFLMEQQDATEGLVTEVFIMDNRGLNAGQSATTSDYWQGDEAKWQDTFGAGPGAVHISEVEFDESTQTYQVQLSMAISDASGVIGAVTFGIDVGMLE